MSLNDEIYLIIIRYSLITNFKSRYFKKFFLITHGTILIMLVNDQDFYKKKLNFLKENLNIIKQQTKLNNELNKKNRKLLENLQKNNDVKNSSIFQSSKFSKQKNEYSIKLNKNLSQVNKEFIKYLNFRENYTHHAIYWHQFWLFTDNPIYEYGKKLYL
jgi:hypothetical protein